jgi:hypothetical protein
MRIELTDKEREQVQLGLLITAGVLLRDAMAEQDEAHDRLVKQGKEFVQLSGKIIWGKTGV